MRFEHLLTEEIIISRMASVSGYKIATSTVTGAFVNLQPLDEKKSSLVNGVYGKTYAIYCDNDLEIKDGDKIKDSNDNYYIVSKGGSTARSQGSIDYKKLIITRI